VLEDKESSYDLIKMLVFAIRLLDWSKVQVWITWRACELPLCIINILL